MLKKALQIAGLVVGAVALCIGGFLAYVVTDWPVKKPVMPVDVHVEATPERLARGKKLVSLRCAGCHYDQETNALTGHVMADAPREFGPIFSHNITRHPTKGAGRYSDGELVYLLRTGIRRDGVFSGPFMESPHLADEDLYSIIAFLRSDDPWVRPLDVDDQQWQASLLSKILMHVAFKPTPMPTETIRVPDAADKVALGRYVAVGLGDCFSCHSADFKTMNVLEPEKSEGYFGGGNPTNDGSGQVIRTANLTMDAETGIGSWSEEDFIKTVRTGFRPDKRMLRYPMVAMPELSDLEVSAVFAYLKTVPPLHNAVARELHRMPSLSASASDGEKLYNKYQCFSCHGTAGVGVCDLRRVSRKYDNDEKLEAFIRDPSRFVPGSKMPTWNEVIAETDYAPLMAHIHALERAAAVATASH